MNRSIPLPPTTLLGLHPVIAGTACCVVSALGYTAANICMRQLAELRCDPTWAIFNKELVTLIVVGPWLLYRALRGLAGRPPWWTLATLMLVGLAVQLGANQGVQWALGVIGLTITIPVIFGVMLTASAVMGRVFLGERVSRRSAAAVGLLLVSLVLLGLSAGAAGHSITCSSTVARSPLLIALAVGAACLAGAIYAVLVVTIRHTVTGRVRPSIVVLIITGMGVLSLGPLAVYRLGMQQLLHTLPEQAAWMLAAGIFNLIAFLAITKGLELTTVVYVNVLNASQVAMAAVAGMMIFHEPFNRWLILGVALTILGVVLIEKSGVRPTVVSRPTVQPASPAPGSGGCTG